MASILGGLGAGLGAAAGGYLAGARAGEAERFRREQIAEQNKLKLLLARTRLKPEKEELPYEVQSFLDTRSRIYGPQGDYRERLDWEGSGNEKVYGLVVQALGRSGPRAARLALAIASQPEGTDTSGLQSELAREMGQAGPPTALGGAAAPIPAGGFGTIGGFLAAQPPPRPAGFAEGVQPSLKPGYRYGPTELEEARTGLVGAQRGLAGAREAQIRAVTPEEVKLLQARTQDIGFQQDLSRRRLNLDAAQRDFDNALKAAQYRSNLGFQDYRLQEQTWADLLNASVRLYYNGGNPADALKPLLFNRGIYGMTTPNPEAISRYLSILGLPANDIQAIIQGAGGAAGGSLGAAPPGGVQQPGGPPVLPQVGAVGAPGQAAGPIRSLGQGLTWAEQRGLQVTSTTGGRHNLGSLHPLGLAFDVGTRGLGEAEVQGIIRDAQAQGLRVRDERTRPKGQKVWRGPHLHFEINPAQAGGAPAGMAPRTTPGQVPAAQGPEALGIRTPATAPEVRNPYAVGTLEGEVFNLYTQGVTADEILRRFKGTPYERAAQGVIDYANTQGRAGLFAGVPVPSRFGARAPEPTSFAGTLGYQEVGIPRVTTTPVEPTAGFGGAPPAPGMVIVPGVSTGAAGPPPGGVPTPSPYTPPPGEPRGGPSLLTAPGELRLPTFRLPSVGLPQLEMGPSLFGAPKRKEEKLPVVRISAAERRAQSKRQEELIRTAKPLTGTKEHQVARQEVQRFRRLPYAAGVIKWFGKHKIGNPIQQQAVFRFVTSELVPVLIQQQWPAERIKNRIFSLLEQQVRPAS